MRFLCFHSRKTTELKLLFLLTAEREGTLGALSSKTLPHSSRGRDSRRWLI